MIYLFIVATFTLLPALCAAAAVGASKWYESGPMRRALADREASVLRREQNVSLREYTVKAIENDLHDRLTAEVGHINDQLVRVGMAAIEDDTTRRIPVVD